MATWQRIPPHNVRCREDVEADVRVLMAKHAAIENRGFDTAAQREILHRRIDDRLDEHAMFVAVAELTESP